MSVKSRVHKGREGQKLARSEAKKAEERATGSREPFRFWLRPEAETEYIILSESCHNYMFEHEIPDPQRPGTQRRISVPCLKEDGICPVCQVHGEETSKLIMMITIIDLTEYEGKSGTVTFSRKLMPVKPSMHKVFDRLQKQQERQNRSLRGIHCTVFRDGQKDPRTGNQVQMTGRLTEAEMQEYIREWTDKESKVHVEKEYEEYNLDEVLTNWSRAELASLVGAPAPAGSDEEVNAELGEDAGEFQNEDDDDLAWADDPEDGEVEGEVGEDEQLEELPDADYVDDPPFDEGEVEEPAPPRRPTQRRTPVAAPPRSVKKVSGKKVARRVRR